MESIEKIKNNGIEAFGRFYSIYPAFVVENADPDNKARLKVVCPSVWGQQPLDEWIYPFGVMAGAGHGFYSLPSEGDSVYIAFEAGNMYAPLWTFGWWGDDELPTEAQNRYDEVTLLKTKGGQMILIDDKDGSIKIQNTEGSNVFMKGEKIVLDAKEIVLSSDAQKAVLGDKLDAFMNDLLDVLIKAKDLKQVPFSPEVILELGKLKAKTKLFLSENVKLK